MALISLHATEGFFGPAAGGLCPTAGADYLNSHPAWAFAVSFSSPLLHISSPLTQITQSISTWKPIANMDFLKKKMKELLDDDDKPKDKPTGKLLHVKSSRKPFLIV